MNGEAVVSGIKLLPRSGYFAIAPDGSPRDGYEEMYEHTIPKNPEHLTPESMVPGFANGVHTQEPFLRKLLETMNFVRELGRMNYNGEAYAWLESRGYVEAIKAVFDHPMRVDVRYKITEKGGAFLKQHEAPLEW